MLEHESLLLTFFLLAILIIYLLASKRNLIKNKALTPHEYLWKLKQITGKSEYELFHIAAKEKGWPEYQVEQHFNRYLEDQTLPVYVKQFLEDGRDHIITYRPKGGDFFNKRLLIFYSLFTLFIIGGSFFISLYFIPRFYPFDGIVNDLVVAEIRRNPRVALRFINRAFLFSKKGQNEKICSDLQLACDLGYCEFYNMKIKEGICL